jgi:hypothetical protein
LEEIRTHDFERELILFKTLSKAYMATATAKLFPSLWALWRCPYPKVTDTDLAHSKKALSLIQSLIFRHQRTIHYEKASMQAGETKWKKRNSRKKSGERYRERDIWHQAREGS